MELLKKQPVLSREILQDMFMMNLFNFLILT